MSDNEHLAPELRLAKAYRAEAEGIKRAAEQDLEAARYERGQIEHTKRLLEQTEASVAQREQKLKELGEDALLARERAADDKLKQAQELMASYDAAKHGAALVLAGKAAVPATGAGLGGEEVDVDVDQFVEAIIGLVQYHDELIHRAVPRQPGDSVRMGQLLGKLRALKKGQRQAAQEQSAA